MVTLTDAQKRDLYKRGAVMLPSIVPPALVATALRAINASLGNQGLPPDQLPILRAQTYCRELTDTPPITDLLHRSPLLRSQMDTNHSSAHLLLTPGARSVPNLCVSA